jgi:hypothetical protein
MFNSGFQVKATSLKIDVFQRILSKNQRVKRLKKTVKETSNKQAKNKKHIKAKNKSTTLKKTQLIKDIFDKSDGCFNK